MKPMVYSSIPRSGRSFLTPILKSLLTPLGCRLNSYDREQVAETDLGENAIIRGHFGHQTVPNAPQSFLELLERWGGRACFIFQYRDPRDIVVSAMNHQRNALVTSESAAQKKFRQVEEKDVIKRFVKNFYWGDSIGGVMRFAVEMQRDPRVFTISYENLSENTKDTVRGLLERIGVTEISDAAIDRAIEENGFDKVAQRQAGVEDKSSHFRKGVAGDWINHFDDDLKNMFKDVCGAELIELGYETDKEW